MHGKDIYLVIHFWSLKVQFDGEYLFSLTCDQIHLIPSLQNLNLRIWLTKLAYIHNFVFSKVFMKLATKKKVSVLYENDLSVYFDLGNFKESIKTYSINW